MQNFMKNSDELPYIDMILDFLINASFLTFEIKFFLFVANKENFTTQKLKKLRNFVYK